jgi:glycosyltransferase involved in cell wall biosynthesis
VVLFVGILNARKNVAWLLDRWLAWPGHSRARLVLAGPSPVGEEALRARVERLAADPSSGVRWLGAVEDVERLYPAADLLLLPSEAEGLPNVALEAMASGVPVALADGSGARDILGPKATGGFLLARGDQSALEAVFNLLETAPDVLRAIGAAARQRMEEGFAIERIAGRYVGLYQELVAGRRRREGVGRAKALASVVLS